VSADVAGLAAASGALTAMGGRTAHASLIARQMGKACVVSCSGLVIDVAAHRAAIGSVPLLEGDWLSVDGDTGEIFLGQIEIVTERPEAMLAEIETWREDAAKHPPPGARRSGVSDINRLAFLSARLPRTRTGLIVTVICRFCRRRLIVEPPGHSIRFGNRICRNAALASPRRLGRIA
jgi:hypothetical protein